MCHLIVNNIYYIIHQVTYFLTLLINLIRTCYMGLQMSYFVDKTPMELRCTCCQCYHHHTLSTSAIGESQTCVQLICSQILLGIQQELPITPYILQVIQYLIHIVPRYSIIRSNHPIVLLYIKSLNFHPTLYHILYVTFPLLAN